MRVGFSSWVLRLCLAVYLGFVSPSYAVDFSEIPPDRRFDLKVDLECHSQQGKDTIHWNGSLSSGGTNSAEILRDLSSSLGAILVSLNSTGVSTNSGREVYRFRMVRTWSRLFFQGGLNSFETDSGKIDSRVEGVVAREIEIQVSPTGALEFLYYDFENDTFERSENPPPLFVEYQISRKGLFSRQTRTYRATCEGRFRAERPE